MKVLMTFNSFWDASCEEVVKGRHENAIFQFLLGCFRYLRYYRLEVLSLSLSIPSGMLRALCFPLPRPRILSFNSFWDASRVIFWNKLYLELVLSIPSGMLLHFKYFSVNILILFQFLLGCFASRRCSIRLLYGASTFQFLLGCFPTFRCECYNCNR